MVTNQSMPPLITALNRLFQAYQDPRVERNNAYPLLEVIVITLPAVMASAEGWEDIETYGKAKEGWLKKFLPLEHGIPIHGITSDVSWFIKTNQILEKALLCLRCG